MTRRYFFALLVTPFVTGQLWAEDHGAQDEPPLTPVVKFAVAAQPAPVPALRYKLLPELRDTSPGNAVPLYYRAFSPEWISNALKTDVHQALEDAQTKPLAELKSTPGAGPTSLDWVRSASFLREVDRAARRQHCDWDMVTRLREDGINLLLPDVQALRNFGRMLAVRARLELAHGDFDKAIYSLQSGLSLARHAADAPTLIQALVGVAIAQAMLNQAEELMRTPGAPNLYWALTTLPHPFIDLRKPSQGERLWIESTLPGFREALADPNTRPLSPAQIEEIGERLARAAGESNGKAMLFAMALKNYSTAKEYLRTHGRTEEQVAALPVLQAVLLYEVAEYDRFFDEYLKWQGQPYDLQRKGLDEAERGLKEMIARTGAPGLSLAGLFLPAVHKVNEATARLDRRIGGLRCVEAIRLYAAAHDGRLPENLAAITAVPLPSDPYTGRPFEYTVVGNTATLSAPPPAGQPGGHWNSFKYEITIVK